MTTYTVATTDGLVMWREDIFATKEEANAFLAQNPVTPNGTPQIVVTTEQAHALNDMRKETGEESQRVLDRVRIRRTAAITNLTPTVDECSPRCIVCGGPDAAGNGCEFCPAVKS